MTEAIQKVNNEAQARLDKVENLLEKLDAAERMLDLGWAEFGASLAAVQRERDWQVTGFESFNAYLESLQVKCKRKKVQLYAYAGCARVLGECGVSAEQMEAMGITKASLLKESFKASGIAPTAEIVAQAIDPQITVPELRKSLFDVRMIGEPPPHENMSWLDLGFYVTAEDRAVIVQGLTDASRVDPVIQTTDLLGDPSAIREALLRMSQDFSGTWGVEAQKGEA